MTLHHDLLIIFRLITGLFTELQVKVIESERNELMSQFITGAERGVDENGLETMYTRQKSSEDSSSSSPQRTKSPYRSPYSSPYKSSYSSYNY